jgi:hypothetical protein
MEYQIPTFKEFRAFCKKHRHTCDFAGNSEAECKHHLKPADETEKQNYIASGASKHNITTFITINELREQDFTEQQIRVKLGKCPSARRKGKAGTMTKAGFQPSSTQGA